MERKISLLQEWRKIARQFHFIFPILRLLPLNLPCGSFVVAAVKHPWSSKACLSLQKSLVIQMSISGVCSRAELGEHTVDENENPG